MTATSSDSLSHTEIGSPSRFSNTDQGQGHTYLGGRPQMQRTQLAHDTINGADH
jgi:hypothetical protein